MITAGYELDDIYDQDATSVLWQQLPAHNLTTGKQSGREKGTDSGTDKPEIFVVGKAKRPRTAHVTSVTIRNCWRKSGLLDTVK